MRRLFFCAVAMLAVGIIGYFISFFFYEDILALLLKSAIFPLTSLTVASSFFTYKNYSDIADLPDIDYELHKNIELEITKGIKWFWPRIFLVLIATLILGVPDILLKKMGSISSLYFGMLISPLGFVLHFIFSMWFDNEKIRVFRSEIKQRTHKEEALQKQILVLKSTIENQWLKEKEEDDKRRRLNS